MTEEGFKIYALKDIKHYNPTMDRFRVKDPWFLAPGGLPFERRLHFQNYLEVEFVKERGQRIYELPARK